MPKSVLKTLLKICVCACCLPSLFAQGTDKNTAAQALRNVPWKQLLPESLAKAKSVVENHTIYRRLPQQAVYCESSIFEFLLLHPNIVVALWEQLGVTQISLKELDADRFLMKETTGTIAKIEVLYRTPNMCVIYAKGLYKGPVLANTVEGDMLGILQYKYSEDNEGEPFVACRLDSFIKIKNPGAELIAKLISPIVGKVVDSNFEQTVAFVGNVSDASKSDPELVKSLTVQLESVRPEVRREMLSIVNAIAKNSAAVYVASKDNETMSFQKRGPEVETTENR